MTFDSVGPNGWGSWIVCHFIAFIVGCIIIKNEWKKRKSTKIVFISQYLRIFPILCMVSGTLAALLNVSIFVPVFCYFGNTAASISSAAMGMFMGYFQLSRLFYCFSQSKIHSSKGYSNTLFIIMFTIAAILMVYCIFQAFVDRIPSKCELNDKYYFNTSKSDYLNISETVNLRTALLYLLYILWDLLTLILYWVKLVSFKRIKSDNIKDNTSERIQYILNRITLLTILYELPIILIMFGFILRILALINHDIRIAITAFSSTISIISMMYSIQLMQQHNSFEYEAFLKLLSKYKIQYVVCCCKSLINDGLEYHLKEIELSIQNNHEFDPDADTMYQTHDITERHGKIENNPNDFSIETLTTEKYAQPYKL